MTRIPVRFADFKGAALVAALFAVMALQGCGDSGGGVASTPAPVVTPTATATATPTPTPTPTATSTPAAVFDTAEYRRSDGPSQHNAIPAWQLGANGTGITLAIIDSGLDTTNPEFAGRISAASTDVAGNRGLINADSNHGTQVALTAAAARNGTGVEGIAWNATIQALRVDSPGTCTDPDGCTFIDPNITTAIDRAVAAGAKVINLSMGGSSPNQALSAAVARAASAGVVIVVSAGNDGATNTTEPDAFASGLRQAGNGNVIIAGSVDANGVISSFSNRAGSEATWFLSALGEEICCIYENGQIKVTTDNTGQQFVTVVSGTSYAAPQVAGALTLLRQYFPNLTAVQAVDLLLKTATDAGATGSDAVYGRGILNIGAAFAPQGATSLAGNGTALVPLSGVAVTTSTAMGDASQTAMIQAVVLDSYQRAYRVNLGLSGAAANFPLTDVLAGPVSDLGGQAGNVAFGFSVARDRFGALRLSPADANAARVLAGRAIVRLARDSRLGFAMARGAESLVAEFDARYRPAFLTIQDPAGQFGFARESLSATAFRHDMAGWGLTVALESGRVRPDPSERWKPGLHARLMGERFSRVALSLDRRFGPLSPHAAAGWLFEDRTVLGARFASALGVNGARSLFLDAGSGLELGRNWRFDGLWRQGWTRLASGGTVAANSAFTSNGWEVSVTRRGLFQSADSLSFGLSQPLRVASGGIGFNLPSAYDYQTRAATYDVTRIGLTPMGREIDRELAWQGQLLGGNITASLFWRSEPGHYRAMPDDLGGGLHWRSGF